LRHIEDPETYIILRDMRFIGGWMSNVCCDYGDFYTSTCKK